MARYELTDAAVLDTETGELTDLSVAISGLPWRANLVPPHEPRMPAHEYVLDLWCRQGERARCWAMLLHAVRNHPESYLAYFRGYRQPSRYLHVGERRYWESWGNGKQFLNRALLGATELPRRVDEGAKPIPAVEWGAEHAFWPQGSGCGYWTRTRRSDGTDKWKFTKTKRPTGRRGA